MFECVVFLLGIGDDGHQDQAEVDLRDARKVGQEQTFHDQTTEDVPDEAVCATGYR